MPIWAYCAIAFVTGVIANHVIRIRIDSYIADLYYKHGYDEAVSDLLDKGYYYDKHDRKHIL